MKMMMLAGWPPEGGAGAFDPRGGTFAVSLEQVNVKEVIRIVGKRVDFTCMFGKDVVNYIFNASDEKTAEKVATILRNHKGMDLISVGNTEIPED